MIHGMILARNEADRWLQQVIDDLWLVCDRVVACDDNSTDKTFDILFNNECEVIKTSKPTWEVDEREVRLALWNKTISKAKHGDWIICLDADELLDNPLGVRYLLNNMIYDVDGIGFKLYDMWSDTHYRDDQYWTAHKRDWVMAIRYDANKDYVWTDRKLHCGRFPVNSCKAMLPTKMPIKHMGWSKEEDRIIKYNRYMKTDPNGVNGILAQYKSILDESPNLIRFGGAK